MYQTNDYHILSAVADANGQLQSKQTKSFIGQAPTQQPTDN